MTCVPRASWTYGRRLDTTRYGYATFLNQTAVWNAPSLEAVLNTNFEELARRLPQFGAIWRSHYSQLQTPAVRCALTQALLSVHWGICTASVPVQHLAPPIPNRYFFVRWLLDTVLPLTDGRVVGQSRQCGLDIGTGAYCVYPLLMVASSPSVDMYATDIDADSLHCAQQHMGLNPRFASRVVRGTGKTIDALQRELNEPLYNYC